MFRISTYLVIFLVFNSNVLGDIPEEFKRDFFNILKDMTKGFKKITSTHVTRDQITYYMHSNKIEPHNIVLDESNLNLLEGTKGYVVFIIHGWTHSGDIDWVLNLKDSFLKTYPDAVVICLDWKRPAFQPYPISAMNVYDVGNFVADMIAKLIDKHHIDMSQIILVGHSLGAQAAGFSGKALRKMGKKLNRIVALDPAGPLFDVRPVGKRLNPTDADVVQVIHTDGGTFGYKDPIGTIDFFPNGGSFQPGCSRVDFMNIFSIVNPVICSHERAYLYFIEAVLKPNQLVARKCSEWSFLSKICDNKITASMGNMTTNVTGLFYLETNQERPYSKKEEPTGLVDRVSRFLKKIDIFN